MVKESDLFYFHLTNYVSMSRKYAPFITDTILCPGAISTFERFMNSRIDDALALPVSEIEQREPTDQCLVEKLMLQGLSRQEIRSQLLAIFLAAKVWFRHPAIICNG